MGFKMSAPSETAKSIASHLFLLLVWHHQLAACQQAHQAPFVIKFISMQHDYSNDTEATQALAQAIEYTTKHKIHINPLRRGQNGERFDATWHSLQLTDCSEDQAHDLLAKIQDPGQSSFTRDFKLSLNEHFDYPRQVEIQWLGQCENLGRKRSRPQGEPNALIAAGGQTLKPSEASATAGSTPPASSSAEPMRPPSTTEAPTTTPVQFTPTEEEPTTTTTMATLFTSEGNADDSNSPSSSTTESSFFSSSFLGNSFGSANNSSGFLLIDNLNLTDVEPSTTTTTTTTTPTTTTTTTTSQPETTTTTDSSNKTAQPADPTEPPSLLELLKSDQPFATTNGTSDSPDKELVGETTTWSAVKEEVEAQTRPADQLGESVVSSTAASIDSLLQSAHPKSSAGGPAGGEPHYGKYVGLTTAFLIFVAYLICARAYRRQGMYELHDSSTSLATRT